MRKMFWARYARIDSAYVYVVRCRFQRQTSESDVRKLAIAALAKLIIGDLALLISRRMGTCAFRYTLPIHTDVAPTIAPESSAGQPVTNTVEIKEAN